jgi:glutamyl-tRNA synthetase
MTDYKKLADRLYPNLPATAETIESKYPDRQMPEGALVTRVAPSPTGFMHLGHLYVALTDERLARQTGGLFYLRVEDTDQKREMEGAVKIIIDSLKRYSLVPDEGEVVEGKEIGNYGPYKQSNRLDFYRAFAKRLVEQGLAYPCFVTTEELEKISAEQEAQKIRPGYRGQWAIWRNKTEEEI